jgi:hypothetical protein
MRELREIYDASPEGELKARMLSVFLDTQLLLKNYERFMRAMRGGQPYANASMQEIDVQACEFGLMAAKLRKGMNCHWDEMKPVEE